MCPHLRGISHLSVMVLGFLLSLMVRDALQEPGIMEDLQQSKNVISSLQAYMFHPAKREDQDLRKKQLEEIKAMLFRSPQLDSVRDALQHIQSDVDGG
jgi:hypothetical protein